MSFRIVLSRTAATQLRSFKRPVRDQVIAGLERLSETASLGQPIRLGPMRGRMGFQFRVELLPVTELVTAVFQFYPDEIHIGITGFLRASGDDPDQGPVSEWMVSD